MSWRVDSALAAALGSANAAFAAAHPGEPVEPQPCHAVIGGAHLFSASTFDELQRDARKSLEEYGADVMTFARAVGLARGAAGQPAGDGQLAHAVYARMLERLEREPVEDYRIDFEDGFGNRTDAEEDAESDRTARVVATLLGRGAMPRRFGIRVRPLTNELRERSLRTLERFTTTLVRARAGALPPGFVVTLAKVTLAEQVAYFAESLGMLELALGLPDESLRFEIMIEVPQAIVGADGRCPLPAFRAAGGRRFVAAHIGTYDYTAGCGITAMHQHMRHQACDFARQTVQAAYAGTGVWIADGSTAVLPVARHVAMPGRPMSAAQERENGAAVHAAWRQHFDDVTHSLVNGFYQGWDLHGAQLPTRYAANYAFFLAGIEAACERLKKFLAGVAGAEGSRAIADDAATGQALLNFVLRAVRCGAVEEHDALDVSGLTAEELGSRSFGAVLESRSAAGGRDRPRSIARS